MLAHQGGTNLDAPFLLWLVVPHTIASGSKSHTSQFLRLCSVNNAGGITYTRYGKGYDADKLAEVI